MVTVLNDKGWRFVFYALNGAEPPHVCIWQEDSEVKFELLEGTVVHQVGCSEIEITYLSQIVAQNRSQLLERWYAKYS